MRNYAKCITDLLDFYYILDTILFLFIMVSWLIAMGAVSGYLKRRVLWVTKIIQLNGWIQLLNLQLRRWSLRCQIGLQHHCRVSHKKDQVIYLGRKCVKMPRVSYLNEIPPEAPSFEGGFFFFEKDKKTCKTKIFYIIRLFRFSHQVEI